MRRPAILVAAAAALVLAPAALAKGPVSASISGPGDGGGGGGITVTGNGEGGNGTQLGRLVDSAGFFPAVFAREPDPTSPVRPAGDLGPKYTITYVVPGPNNEEDTLVQEVYPYAKPAAVTYMRPGQPVFGTERTHGGWFVGGEELRRVVLGAATAAAPPSDVSPSSPSDGPWPTVAVLALALLAAAVCVVAVRRREAAPAR